MRGDNRGSDAGDRQGVIDIVVKLVFKFYHLSPYSKDVACPSQFYPKVFCFGRIDEEEHRRVEVATDDSGKHSTSVEPIIDSAIEFHLAAKDVNLSFRMKQPFNLLHPTHVLSHQRH